MARIAGVDLPREKRLEIGLTYIFGIGRSRAAQACAALDIDPGTKVRDLTDDEVVRLRQFIDGMGSGQLTDRIYCMYVYSMKHDLKEEDWSWIEESVGHDKFSHYALALALEQLSGIER